MDSMSDGLPIASKLFDQKAKKITTIHYCKGTTRRLVFTDGKVRTLRYGKDTMLTIRYYNSHTVETYKYGDETVQTVQYPDGTLQTTNYGDGTVEIVDYAMELDAVQTDLTSDAAAQADLDSIMSCTYTDVHARTCTLGAESCVQTTDVGQKDSGPRCNQPGVYASDVSLVDYTDASSTNADVEHLAAYAILGDQPTADETTNPKLLYIRVNGTVSAGTAVAAADDDGEDDDGGGDANDDDDENGQADEEEEEEEEKREDDDDDDDDDDEIGKSAGSQHAHLREILPFVPTLIEDDVFLWKGAMDKNCRVELSLTKIKPHFMLLLKPDIERELDQRHAEVLVATVTRFIDLFQLDSADPGLVPTTSSRVLMSIHRGTWIKESGRLVAQIATDADSYIEVFNDISAKIPRLEKFYKAYRGATGSLQDHYVQEVTRYPYRRYHDREIAGVKKVCEESRSTFTAPSQSTNCDLKPECHKWLPRVGFTFTNRSSRMTPRDLMVLLLTMENYAVALEMSNTEQDDCNVNGCHICLNMSSLSSFDRFECDTPVHGYIQMAGPVFYQQCPPEKRDQWFTNFCKTTDAEIYT